MIELVAHELPPIAPGRKAQYLHTRSSEKHAGAAGTVMLSVSPNVLCHRTSRRPDMLNEYDHYSFCGTLSKKKR